MVDLDSSLGTALAALWARLCARLSPKTNHKSSACKSVRPHCLGKASYRYHCCTLCDRPAHFDDVAFVRGGAAVAATSSGSARSYQSSCCRTSRKPRARAATASPSLGAARRVSPEPEDEELCIEQEAPRPRRRWAARRDRRQRLSARLPSPDTAWSLSEEEVEVEEPQELLSPSQQQSFRKLSKWLAEKKKGEGNLAYAAKKYKQALDLYSQAIELCPQCAAYRNNRSACLLMLGQHRQALNEAREAVRLDPSYVKGLLRVAKCQVILGDVAGADAALRQAAALDPQNSAVVTERRNLDAVSRLSHELDVAFQKADYRRALFCAERALTVATGSAHLRVRRAECLVLLGRYSEAQDIVQDMLRSDSMNADAIYVRGMCLYYQDDVDKAFNHFQQVLRLAPDHQRARAVYRQAKALKAKKEEGNAAFKSGRLQEALALYTAALEIDPANRGTNSKLYFNRATVQARLSNAAEAIADCTKAIELDSTYLKAYLRRAKSYMQAEQYQEAVHDYEKVCQLERTQEHHRLLSQAKLELKKSKRKDYYKILNLSRSATNDEIKKAYRKQALVHHPDRHSNASEDERREQEHKFKEVGEAYAVLSDRNKRSRYDNGQDLDEDGSGGFGGDFDHANIFQAFFGGPQAGGFRFSGGGGGPQFDFGGYGGPGGGFQYTFG